MSTQETAESRRRSRANGEGGIYQDKARKRWVGTVTTGYDDAGKQVRRSVTGKTKGQVAARLRELQGAVDQGQDPARRDLTLSRFLDLWLDDVLPGSVAAATEVQYRDIVRLYVKPHLGQKRLSTLTARDVARMLAALEAEDRSPNTRRLARSVLRRALRWAEQEGMIARNVAAIANGVKVGASEGRTMTVDQARTFLASVANDRLEAAYVVALALGLRRGELLGLAWADVDLDAERPTLTVRRSLKRLPKVGLVADATKTKGSRRRVHLPAQAVDALRRHRLRMNTERLKVGPAWPTTPLGFDLIFRSPLGTPMDPDNFRQATYRATEGAGMGRWSPHELRHSAASLLIAQNVPLKVVSEVLGHSGIRITADVYGHLLDDAGVVAADAMSAILGG